MADFLLITGDAWVDHPSFGAAVIYHVLRAEGYSVDVLAQPEWRSAAEFAAFARPRLAALITAGNLDSMVAHYTAAKKRRGKDFYSPGGRTGLRPDRAVTVYSNRTREAFRDLPVIIGGLEASLRRFAHYDYWSDSVRRSVLLDSGADLLVYGMGERAIREAAARLNKGETLDGIRGTCVIAHEAPDGAVRLPGYEDVCADKAAYALSVRDEYAQHDPFRGKTLTQAHGKRYLVCYPPAKPLDSHELDEIAEYPYTRLPDSRYSEPVPSIEEVRFSIIHNRGCFGSCNFCSLAFHQGRFIQVRSHESLLREAINIASLPDFKGYIHDVGGPTANFRHPSCKNQLTKGLCENRNCLTPTPCPSLDASHSDFIALLRKLRTVKGVKKVFIRSGLRYDYLMADKNGSVLPELIEHHVSGQLKVAPEHCVDSVLAYMGKPDWRVYEKFREKYMKENERAGKKQFLVPYLISSHPGCRLEDAIKLAETLRLKNMRPEQVQDFYPTPGTISTAMYYTGLDPRTMKPVYVPEKPLEKAMQRALLQWFLPQNKRLVIEALRKAGREDLIGFGKRYLVGPDTPRRARKDDSVKNSKTFTKPGNKDAKKVPRSPAGKSRPGADRVKRN